LHFPTKARRLMTNKYALWASFVPRTRRLLNNSINNVVWFWQKLSQIRERDAGFDCSRRSAYIYLALFAPVIVSLAWLNAYWNAIIDDTILLFSDFEGLTRFSSLWSNLNADPLQALFDIFPSGHRQDTVPNLLAQALFGPGMHITFFNAFCAVLLTLGVVAMARAAEMRWSVAILAGILLPLMIMPLIGTIPLGEDMYILWPILYYSAAITTFITALFWRIGKSSWMWSAPITAVIIVLLIHLSLVQILHMTMMAPAILAMGAAALAASNGRRELISKIVCGLVVVVALGAAGIFQYLYATGLDNAQYVFYQELPVFMNYGRPHLVSILDDFSVVFYSPLSPIFHVRANVLGAVIVPLSQLGAVYLALLGKTRTIRIFGRAMILWIAATALSIAIIHNYYYYTGHAYMGPNPQHFIEILWPYYVICSANLILAIVEYSAAAFSRAGRLNIGAPKYVPHGVVIFALVAAATPVAARVLFQWEPTRPLFSRFEKRNAVVNYLEAEIGIGIDREFRGTTIFMPSIYDQDIKPYGMWHREVAFQAARAFLGNDLGQYSLHHFNIPTLDEVTHNITPQFYLIGRELLSRPGIDKFDRHFGGVTTRLNVPILQLLGVRFLLADYELPVGAERLTMPIPDSVLPTLEAGKALTSPVRVYELPHPNVGNYSPTETVRANTAKQAILAMSQPDFDGRQKVLVTGDQSLPNNLVPAAAAAMTVRFGGVALSASSTGQSLLVLPVQFSHCWRIVSGGDATLFRANLMQLGVLFSGELRLELRQIFGPFGDSACRVADAADATGLQMVDAAGTVGDENKIAGDGINLIPRADALDQVIGYASNASIKAIDYKTADDAHPTVRTYKIAAEGSIISRSQHYLVLDLPPMSPGLYTLSMEVPNDTLFIALEMRDAANDGVYVDYLPAERQAWIYEEGIVGRCDATTRPINNDWFQITLTSTLSTELGNRIFIRLKDGSDHDIFRSRGQSVVVRAVKLERGEKATASPRLGESHADD
jgi:hypothetical protein